MTLEIKREFLESTKELLSYKLSHRVKLFEILRLYPYLSHKTRAKNLKPKKGLRKLTLEKKCPQQINKEYRSILSQD